MVKEVRFDARTPASAIVSESDGDSPVVAASPPRKLYLDAPAPRNRSSAVAWVLLAAFVARDGRPSRRAGVSLLSSLQPQLVWSCFLGGSAVRVHSQGPGPLRKSSPAIFAGR